MSGSPLKSQDILLLCKLLVLRGDAQPTQKDLSSALGVNQSEISTGYERLISSNLVNPISRMPNKMMVFEFLKSAVKFFFPAKGVEYTLGIPTSIYAEPLSRKISGKGPPLIWPSANGTVHGIGLMPLHESVPFAASQDKNLYELLTVIDALRSFSTSRINDKATEILKSMVLGTKYE